MGIPELREKKHDRQQQQIAGITLASGHQNPEL
jgi:hypothetical protein